MIAGNGALPEKHPLRDVIGVFSIVGRLSMPIYMVGTSGAKVGLNFPMVSNSGSGCGLGTRISPHPIKMAKFMAVVRPNT